MNENSNYLLADRVSNLEKYVEILIDWLEKISPEVRELRQRIEGDCKY